MTRLEQQNQWKRLADVRGAIRGWAFTRMDMLPHYIQHASAERDKLTGADWDAADALIQPLRERKA